MAAFVPSLPMNATSIYNSSAPSLRSSSFLVSPVATKYATLPARPAAPLTTPFASAKAPAAAPTGVIKQTGDSFADKVINSIRFLAIDAVEKANSGHPGMPMGMAPSAFVLFDKIMKYNPKNPYFFNRDRFVLSAGHGSMLQYALLYLFGYDSLTIEDLKQFRQLGSKTPGHPENFMTAGVEVTTGPLGQGICNAVGLAMAEAHLAAVYNKPDAKIVDHYTYCILGDGCVMEGVSAEACSLAGHLGLGKLIALYDDNSISIDGHTDISFTEDVGKRFEAYGWQVINVPNGNTDIKAIEAAITLAKSVTDKPTLIKVTTIIGYGSPNKADSHDVHGAALGAAEVEATRKYLGWSHPPFEVPTEVTDHTFRHRTLGEKLEAEWNAKFAEYKQKYPKEGAQFELIHLKGQNPPGWEEALRATGEKSESMATRQLSQIMLNTLAPILPNLIGGSADLAPSNLTIMKGFGDFQKDTPQGRNLRFGVREHGMGAIVNGIGLHGSNLIPYCATFFIFTDYMRGAMRVSALSECGVIFVMTHDSVALGEDGPTHQPIEHLASFRAMPNLYTYRPCDGVETAAAYAVAVHARKTPTLLVLTRQKLTKMPSDFDKAKKGGYVLSDNTPAGSLPHSILIGTGSEVELCQAAAETIRKEGKHVRVVSMPCVELFEEQDPAYREAVLPAGVPLNKRLVCEAATSFGWHKYAHNFVCIDDFGISAPGNLALKHFGITKENVTEQARKL